MFGSSHYPKHLWTTLQKQWPVLKRRRSGGLLLRKRVQHRGFCAHQFHNQPKPLWERREVIHLKALCPNAGCRAVAHLFNHRYAHSKNMTVSKSWACTTWQKHRHDILIERRRIRKTPAFSWPKNQLWQIDLCQIPDLEQQPQRIFGCIDTGTRACLAISPIERKNSPALLQLLLTLCRIYGVPKAVQTDNEPCFTSFAFWLGLFWMGIQHRTTDIASPWQNGRIERLFGTFKQAVKQVAIPRSAMVENLEVFRRFYNHVRPHSNLGGKTSAEVWSGKPHNRVGKAYYVDAWDGVLRGMYLPP